MRNMTVVGRVTIAALLTSCSPGSTLAPDTHVDCAALISAATFAIASGAVPADAEVQSKALYAAMMHVNSWAVPAGISETEAMDTVKSRREELTASMPGDEIVSRAKACIARVD